MELEAHGIRVFYADSAVIKTQSHMDGAGCSYTDNTICLNQGWYRVVFQTNGVNSCYNISFGFPKSKDEGFEMSECVDEGVTTNEVKFDIPRTSIFKDGTSTSTPTSSLTSNDTYLSTNTLSESTNATLYAWGAQESSGLPIGEVSLPESLDVRVIGVSGGSRYSLIVLSDGTAQSSGYIDSVDLYQGHLGLKALEVSEGSNKFQNITSSFDNGEIINSPPFTRVFAGVEQTDNPGSIHSFFIDDQGQVWATGSNANGELCLGDNEDRLIPTRVTLDGNVISVAIGSKHTVLLLEGGTVYTCGSNEDGQLAIAEAPESFRSTPTKVEDIKDVRMISAGIASSLFLASDGLYVAGNNAFGQLCVYSNTESIYKATKLDAVNTPDVASFEAIATSTYILFRDGSVAACGRNNFGQLADGTNDDRIRVVMAIPDGIAIRRLGVGPSSQSAFFINDDGSIYATGLNDRGQLGVGDTENKNTLTLVEYTSSNNQVLNQVSTATDHTLATSDTYSPTNTLPESSQPPTSSPPPSTILPTFSPTEFTDLTTSFKTLLPAPTHLPTQYPTTSDSPTKTYIPSKNSNG